ncbi:MAG: hypothetical protein ACI9AP_000907, partial [Flavobacteriales bacterium]
AQVSWIIAGHNIFMVLGLEESPGSTGQSAR